MLHCVCFKWIKFLSLDSETTTNISQHLVSWLITFFVYNQLFCLRLRTFLPFCFTIFLSFLLFTKKIWSFLKANVWFNMLTQKSCSLVRCDDEVYENKKAWEIKTQQLESFATSKTDRHLLHQKVCQKISVIITNTCVFVVFKTNVN